MLVIACITMASNAVNAAVTGLMNPVSDKQTAQDANTGATATPNVFGRMASNQAFTEWAETFSTSVIKEQP